MPSDLNVEASETETHFGFTKIPESEKAGKVHGVFESVASKYDIMNDVMSGGIHRLWKESMIDWLAPRKGMKLLDVAGGTGDISFRFLKRIKNQGHATVCDMTAEMLINGQQRPEAIALQDKLDWVCGDAMALPFPDNTFDAYTISFGIRNVTRIQDAINEAYRVLRPGGRFICLEFSHVVTPGIDQIYDAYSFNVIPKFGKLITGDEDSYQYLVESIRQFPKQEEFRDMIQKGGFERASYRNMINGVAALHSGWKI